MAFAKADPAVEYPAMLFGIILGFMLASFVSALPRLWPWGWLLVAASAILLTVITLALAELDGFVIDSFIVVVNATRNAVWMLAWCGAGRLYRRRRQRRSARAASA